MLYGCGDAGVACNVCAEGVVAGVAKLCGGVAALLVHGFHDGFELGVCFFEAPLFAAGVLAHFEATGGNSAGVGCFAGAYGDASGVENVFSFGGAGHVGAFCEGENPVVTEGFGVVFVEFVLGGAG